MSDRLDPEVKKRLDFYLAHETYVLFQEEVQKLLSEGNVEELHDRFYTELEFGTGGIRGILGGGSNRLNHLMVQRVAASWAEYLLKQFSDAQIKVVIAYDSRRFSQEFAQVTSQILCAKGIHVFCYPAPRPTPQLSFTIRALEAQSGLVITASHNPPEYNGMKLYWQDGAQLVPPHDQGIMDMIATSAPPYKSISLQQAKELRLYTELGLEMDEKFQDYVSAQLYNSDTLHQNPDYKIVYTPLHGTGAYHMEKLMQNHALSFVIEPSQKEPDGEFPTVTLPNPEMPESFQRALQTARAEKADIVIATDPDADRVGLAVQDQNSEKGYSFLTGNQLGSLLLEYIAATRKEKGLLSENSVFINTIVTSLLQEKIASFYNIHTIKTFTGFKNIAEEIRKIDKEGQLDFVFSCEESYGYLPSMAVRDKDGIAASMLCIDMAKYYASVGMNLLQKLDELYLQHGYHEERSINKHYLGESGRETMQRIMKKFRESIPSRIGTQVIQSVSDYKAGSKFDVQKKRTEKLKTRSQDVLIFTTEEGNRVCVRPSGTEPKIKLYLLYSLPKDQSKNLAVAQKQLSVELDIVTAGLEEFLL